jgi:peroxin-4
MASSHNLAAAKRLRKELQALERSSLTEDDVYLRPSSDSILQWTALLKGPPDTPYEGGVFQLSITCGSDYPLAPPSIKFITKVFHPNVHFKTGAVCLDILKKEWSPAWGLQAACRAVLALLSDADAESPLNCDAGNMLRGDQDLVAYRTTAKMYTFEHALCLAWPEKRKAGSDSS